MYQSRRRISQAGLAKLNADLVELLRHRKKIYCRVLRRSVFLAKLPDAITKRYDSKRRLQALEVALDIVRHTSECNERLIKGYRCYELRGRDAAGTLVIIHIREEMVQKDRLLFLVSCATK